MIVIQMWIFCCCLDSFSDLNPTKQKNQLIFLDSSKKNKILTTLFSAAKWAESALAGRPTRNTGT